MECRDEFFQFREQNADKSGDRCFELSTLLDFVKPVSRERL